MDLNLVEYVEFYGDSFSALQIISYINKISIFINFLNIVLFIVFPYISKKRAVRDAWNARYVSYKSQTHLDHAFSKSHVLVGNVSGPVLVGTFSGSFLMETV